MATTSVLVDKYAYGAETVDLELAACANLLVVENLADTDEGLVIIVEDQRIILVESSSRLREPAGEHGL
jgi:hypothetical protein